MRLCEYCQFLCGVFVLLTGTNSLTLSGNPPPGVSTYPGPADTATSGASGVIAGAAVGACIALSALLGALFWYFRRRRVRPKALEPLPLSTTNQSAITPQQALEPRTPLGRTMSTTSHTASADNPVKAEYRGNTIPSMVSASGSSGVGSSSTGARNIPPTRYSSPRSPITTPNPPSPPSLHLLLPPPSYAAAASDLQIHEEHSDQE